MMDVCGFADLGATGLFVAAGLAVAKLILDKLDEMVAYQRERNEREGRIERLIKVLEERDV